MATSMPEPSKPCAQNAVAPTSWVMSDIGSALPLLETKEASWLSKFFLSSSCFLTESSVDFR